MPGEDRIFEISTYTEVFWLSKNPLKRQSVFRKQVI